MRRVSFSWLAGLGLGLLVALAWGFVPSGLAEARSAPRRPALHSPASAGPVITATSSSTGTALITAVDTQSFPDLTVYVAVNDTAGQRLAQLPPEAFTLTENASPLPPGKLAVAEKEVGVQMVFALDTSAPFKTRDANAFTRLDYIKQALLAFGTQAAPRLADGIDDVTLLAPEGALVTHTSQGGEFAKALGTIPPPLPAPPTRCR